MRDPEYRIVVYQGGPHLWTATVEQENKNALVLDKGTPHVHWDHIQEVWDTSRTFAVRDADDVITKRRRKHARRLEQDALRLATMEILPR